MDITVNVPIETVWLLTGTYYDSLMDYEQSIQELVFRNKGAASMWLKTHYFDAEDCEILRAEQLSDTAERYFVSVPNASDEWTAKDTVVLVLSERAVM